MPPPASPPPQKYSVCGRWVAIQENENIQMYTFYFGKQIYAKDKNIYKTLHIKQKTLFMI